MTQEENAGLLGCPFCGTDATLRETSFKNWDAFCPAEEGDCPTSPELRSFNGSRNGAIDAWNTRATPPSAAHTTMPKPVPYTDGSLSREYEGDVISQITPPGWKLVPVEPTYDMKQAGSQKWRSDIREHKGTHGQALDIYKAMLSASPAAPAASDGWFPMESAPRDGTKILILIGGDAVTVQWHVEYGEGYWKSAVHHQCYYGSEDEPTHWMPHTPPRAASDEKDET